jgi:gliding motility-associated-like protein
MKNKLMLSNKIALLVVLIVTMTTTFSQANNNCASATSLTPNASCTNGTLSGSNVQTGEVTAAASHCGTANFNQSVWYSFTATSTSMWVQLDNISLSGGGNGYFPGRLATLVYNSTSCLPGVGSVIGCDSHADNLSVVPLTGLTVGNTYLVQVGYNDGNGSQQVSFCINVSANPPYYCFNPQPFCSNSGITFPASINTSAPQGPAYNCLITQPNPAWFYLEIDQPGNLSITLSSSPAKDIDFVIWGPFPSLQAGCEYGGITNATNVEDCSFSGATSEIVDITNAQTGEVYILMITNFSNDPTNITANQTSGTGSTDCDILFPCSLTASNSGPVCAGASFNLNATTVDGATYTWSGPAFTSSVQNPTNITAPTTPGSYTYTVTADDGSVTCQSTTTLVVNANPVMTSASALTICSGASVNLSLTSNPAGSTFSWQAANNSNVGGESTTAQSTSTISDILTNSTGSAQNVVYTVTPSLNGCSGTQQTVTVTVNPITTPTFNPVGPYCSGASIPALPTTSTNGVVGTWSPAINNTTTTTYTFTPNAGQCATSTTLTITINPNVTPAFDPVGPYCSGTSIPALPTTSTNGITGTWSPAINNTTTTTYTFTPSAGQCATSTTLTITVNSNITPTFNAVGPYCSGASIPALPTTSTNGISGTWSPAINNTATTIYTFTPTAGQCATSTTLTITINANVVPSFAFGTSGVVCSGDAVPTLPLTSTNGVAGTWSPSTVSNTVGNTYTFTPNAGQCAVSTSYTQTVNSLPQMGTSPTVTPSDCGLANGAITGAAVSGNGSLAYSWTNNTNTQVGTAVDLVNIPAGTYNLLVVDGNGCDIVFGPYSVINPGSPDPPTITASSVGVCVGETFTLTASSPVSNPTFNWTGPNISGNASSVTVSNAALVDDGLYSVTVTENNCTSGAASINIDVFANPIADAGNDAVVTCANPTPVLSASGGVTYEWNTPNGTVLGSTINLDATSTIGTYEVTVTDGNGCIDTDEVMVSIDINEPVASINTPQDLNCLNSTVQLDGSPSVNHLGNTSDLSYSWVASGGGNIVSGANSPIATVNAAGTYTLTVSMSNGCSSTQLVNVISDIAQPVIDLIYDNVLTCAVTTIDLNASGTTGNGLTFSWVASNGGLIDSGANSAIATVSTAGTYEVTVTGSNGCSSTSTVNISQDIAIPIVVIATPQMITCSAPIITVDGSASSGGAEFLYQWSTVGGNIVGLTDLSSVQVNAQGDYTLQVTNTVNDCVNSATVTVLEDASIPVADAGQDVTLTCATTSVSLDGTGSSGVGITYNWSGPGILSGANTASPLVNQAGTYTLTIISTNGCTAIDEVDVIPDANLPIANGGPNATLTCIATNVVLDGSSSAAGSSIVYQWVTLNGNILSGGSTTLASVNQAGTYTLIVTNTDNGCFSTDDVIVFNDTALPTANAGADQELSCSQTDVTLSGAASSGSGITYLWTTIDGNIAGTNNTVSILVNQPGTYTLTVTGANGCSSSDDVLVTQDADVPVVVISNPQILNCNVTNVTISGANSTGNNLFYQWTTTNGTIVGVDTTESVVVSAQGTYTLTITSDNGCSASGSVVVQAVPSPIADFTSTPTSGMAPLVVTMENLSSGSNLNYVWQFGAGANSSDVDAEFTYTSLGTYIVSLTVTDDQGCISIAYDTISVLGESYLVVPNIFTPNNDNMNDLFLVNALYITEFKGVIFNRWGRLMYEWNDVTQGWDGLAPNGAQASEGTYYYVITGTGEDGKPYDLQGHFMLMR